MEIFLFPIPEILRHRFRLVIVAPRGVSSCNDGRASRQAARVIRRTSMFILTTSTNVLCRVVECLILYRVQSCHSFKYFISIDD